MRYFLNSDEIFIRKLFFCNFVPNFDINSVYINKILIIFQSNITPLNILTKLSQEHSLFFLVNFFVFWKTLKKIFYFFFLIVDDESKNFSELAEQKEAKISTLISTFNSKIMLNFLLFPINFLFKIQIFFSHYEEKKIVE